jgi:hypothetical protein
MIIPTLLLSLSFVVVASAKGVVTTAAPLEVKEFSFADEMQEAFVVALKSKSKGAHVASSQRHRVCHSTPHFLFILLSRHLLESPQSRGVDKSAT